MMFGFQPAFPRSCVHLWNAMYDSNIAEAKFVTEINEKTRESVQMSNQMVRR